MNYNKKTVSDVDVHGKKVLLRCDFNVPLEKGTGRITDDGRIVAALPTFNYLLEHGAAIIACSHLGRPKGKWDPALSLRSVGARLSELLGRPVKMAEDVVGDSARGLAAGLQPGEVMLLENLRFHPEEEANNAVFACALANMADLYVSDAFGTVHRAHASVEGVAAYLPAVAGFLLAKELLLIGRSLESPKRPLIAVLGGAKVSDKLAAIQNLIGRADTVIVGGGMAYTFIKSQGGAIGSSLCENDKLDAARGMIKSAQEHGVKLMLPDDSVVAASPDSADTSVCPSDKIPDGLMGLDIGPKAAAAFAAEIKNAGTMIWNGPMGVFENPLFERGTKAVADALATSGAISIVGGGDSAAAIRKFGLGYTVTHVSTGGGATLEFLEGRDLPGVACLLDK